MNWMTSESRVDQNILIGKLLKKEISINLVLSYILCAQVNVHAVIRI